MRDQDESKQFLLAEVAKLRQRLALATDRKQAERQLATLMSNLPGMAYRCKNDEHWTMEFVSDGCMALTGYAAEDLVGNRSRAYADLIHPDDRQLVWDTVQQAVAQRRHFKIEYRIHTASGEEKWVWEQGIGLYGNHDRPDVLEGFITDVTARKKAEAALIEAHRQLEDKVRERTAELTQANESLRQSEEWLRRSERRFRSYFEQGLIGMAVTSMGRRWLAVNDRLCELLGYSREELLDKNWVDLTHPEDREINLEFFERLVAGRIDHFTLEKRFLHHSGRTIYAMVHVRAFRTEDGSDDHVVALIEDVTARRQAMESQQKERRTLEHLLRASDRERQLIAYDIHDGLAQQLAGAIMQFEVFDHLKEAKPKQAADAFGAGLTMLRQSHFEARRLISGVRPPILDESGVVAAVAHLVNDQTLQPGPRIEFRSKVRFQRLAPLLENVIYRIIQEGLTNAARHSKSETVRIALLQRDDTVRIEVRDWGVGFDPHATRENRFGLEGIRERARLLGGTSRIRTRPGKGTLLVVELPLVECQKPE